MSLHIHKGGADEQVAADIAASAQYEDAAFKNLQRILFTFLVAPKQVRFLLIARCFCVRGRFGSSGDDQRPSFVIALMSSFAVEEAD